MLSLMKLHELGGINTQQSLEAHMVQRKSRETGCDAKIKTIGGDDSLNWNYSSRGERRILTGRFGGEKIYYASISICDISPSIEGMNFPVPTEFGESGPCRGKLPSLD